MAEDLKDALVRIDGATLSTVTGQNASELITGTLSLARSPQGLHLSISNEIDLELPREAPIDMGTPVGSTSSQLAFFWPFTFQDPSDTRKYQLVFPVNTTSDVVQQFMSTLNEWCQLNQGAKNKQADSGLVLMDEDGQILGQVDLELDPESRKALESKPGQFGDADEPIIIQPSAPGEDGEAQPTVSITPFSALRAQYGQSTSKIVQGAEYLSKGLIWGGESLSNAMDKRVQNTTTSTAPTSSPLVFSQRTKSNFGNVHSFTGKAANISSATLGRIAGYASKAGTSAGRRMGLSPSDPSAGEPATGFKGFLNNSLKAGMTLAESVDVTSKHLMNRSQANSVAYTTHRYGNEAGGIVNDMTGSAKHVGLVFVDARGLGRTALLKGFGKGVIRAKTADGQIVELQSGDPDLASATQLSPSGSPKPPGSPSGYSSSGGGGEKGTPPPLPARSSKPTPPPPAYNTRPTPTRQQLEAQANQSISGQRRTPSPNLPPRSTPSPHWNDPPFKS